MDSSNILAEGLIRHFDNAASVVYSFQDENNVLWKLQDGKWIGKRSVYCKDFSCKWLEESTPDEVKTYWCGQNADYKEIFVRN